MARKNQIDMKSIKNEHGYAMVEIVFLITVIAILASIILPKVSHSFQTVQADYFIKTIYSELRFIQATSRVTSYRKDKIFEDYNTTPSFSVTSFNPNIRVEFRDHVFRKYIMPSYLSFEQDFSITINNEGIIRNSKGKSSNSGNILLKNGSEKFKPVIVYDSVGRIRFSEN